MMLPDKKKVSTLIISKMRKDSPGEMFEAPKGENGGESDDSLAKESAAEELLKAIESKSPAAIAEAFSAMLELCGGEQEADEASEAPKAE